MMPCWTREEGFAVYNADNYGGHIDFTGKGEGIVGVVGHLDVVPEGDGWSFDPYGGEVKDGWICGRGTTDDKGPVIASFYGMKALKACGYEPKKTIRLILGLDEETNWHGMDHYLELIWGSHQMVISRRSTEKRASSYSNWYASSSRFPAKVWNSVPFAAVQLPTR